MIQLLIVDDDPFIRESLKLILELDPELTVAGTAQNGLEAVEFVRSRPVDLVLMDIRMPECDGVEGTRRLKAEFPHVAVLILTTFDDDEYIIEALQNGAGGYMLKNIPPDRIIEGIKTVFRGSMLIHPHIARKLAGLLHREPEPGSSGKPVGVPGGGGKLLESYGLTPNEQQVVMKIAEGKTNKEIAQELFLSEGTVKNYITEILSKLSLRDRTQIAIFYLKQG